VLAEQFPSNYYPWQRRAEETGASLKVVAWPMKTMTGPPPFWTP
jgi:selenocysteine lyase/cysteine desulfurase